MTVNWLCVGICFIAIAGSIIVSILYVSKVKEEMADLATERKKLESEKSDLELKESQLKSAQEDLKNAQILFQKEKEAKCDLSKKTEKEVAIDLFLKFLEMESVFSYIKNNLASIDSKLVGVKNYSDDLESMKNEVTISLDALASEMTSMQENYSSLLSLTYNNLTASLTNIEDQIEGIVSAIIEKEMMNLRQSVNENQKKINASVNQKLASLSSEFGDQIARKMPRTIKADDIKSAVNDVLSEYTFSDLDADDVRRVMDDLFGYSFDFEDGVKSAIRDEIGSQLSNIESELSDIKSEVSN